MASQPPDPKTLETWEDAFQYPLPVVRRLEQQLRRHIDDNRQKLRSLVGTSYRDLLGTAERIIDMDAQMQLVESHMAHIGRQCNSRKLEKIGDNHKSVRSERRREEDVKFSRLAQTKVLQNALNVTSRIVKSGGDALVAAKILLLARLLHKSLAEGGDPPAVLESLRRQLASARKRLLSYIARALAHTSLKKAKTINTLCAYSLLTACAPKDVLRYFLQIRFEQLELMAEVGSETSLLDMLALYSQTLLDAREVFPRRFADSLSHISTTTLLRDPDIQEAHELSLDIYERWIVEDVRHFHPWARHDELSTASVGAATSSWEKQAQECLLQTLKDALSAQQDVHTVLQLRQKVITNYLVLSAKVRGDIQAQSLVDLREAFLEHLESLADEAASITGFLPQMQQHDAESGASNLWDVSTGDLDLGRGSAQFRDTILKRHHGRNQLIQESSIALDLWLARLRGFGEAIVTMGGTKWDEDIDLDLDDLAGDEPLQVVLSKQDPRRLERKLQQATLKSLQAVYTTLENSSSPDTDPALLIRILREVDDRRRSLAELVENIGSVKSSDTFVATLHQQLAKSVIAVPLADYTKRLHNHSRVAVTLWDGSPPLPIQPSPSTFRFLKSLHQYMSDVGTDLWCPHAVQTLKTCLVDTLDDKTMLVHMTHGAANADLNGPPVEFGASGVATPTVPRERSVQQLFDVMYLRRVLMTSAHEPAGSPGLREVADTLQTQLGADTGVNYERLEKSAEAYWKRTYLLFGLLAAAAGQATS